MTDSLSPFSGGGQVGLSLAEVDWSGTALGSPDHWSQSLRSAVRMVLSSRFSMWMGWGPDLTFFCNDAYRRDTLGAKYPWALGRPAREVWAEIWPDIAPRTEQVMTTGEATWDEALLLFLERSGYSEETYHTFSYSPLHGDDGTVQGMLCVVTEDTERVISSRRIGTLSALGAALTRGGSERDVVKAACAALEQAPQSLPFVLLYGLDDGRVPQLLAGCGIGTEHPATDPSAWPWESAVDEPVVVDDLPPDLPTGAWDKPPAQALVVPLHHQVDAPPLGFLVAGLNRHRRLDEDYTSFVSLVAGQVAAALAAARAFDDERRRADELTELDRAKTAFFTNVSHELRTPLTLLLGPAEDALHDTTAPLPEVQRGRLEVINRNAQRLLRLVNTLLDFSRLESGATVGRFAPVDLAAYTAELAHSFDGAAARAGLVLEVDCRPLSEPIWVDQEMWATVVLNLLSNALKFTFEGGITVTLEEGTDDVVLTVRDTGTGVPAHRLGSLFERFQRVDGAPSRSHEGTGIGLALVAELAEVHGGSAAADSEVGAGSTFTVRVPRGSAHLPADHLDDPVAVDVGRRAQGYLAEADRWLAQDAPPVTQPPTDRPRVLLADDNADMRDYVSTLLREAYDVTSVADGAQALAAALADPPDLVLTDVMMPRLDGFGLLARLRADSRTAAVPVVMLSARAGEEATVDGLDAGADDYLVKPFSGRELLARVRSNLELDRVRRTRAELERSSELLDRAQRLARVGSWEYDLATGRLHGSAEFARQVRLPEVARGGLPTEEVMGGTVREDDRRKVVEHVVAAMGSDDGAFSYEVRIHDRLYRTTGEVVRDEAGEVALLRGSNQDITDQRAAEVALADATAAREVSAREHRIADDLQASLLPALRFSPEHLDVATYYKAGVEGTQVGGDWYDVIELGAGRTAFVIGDVMGRGVRAAAVMGQLRAAVRAYAYLDLPPADVLEHLDAAVREIGDDQIVTCLYAVYDPSDRQLTYASAGHLPALLGGLGAQTAALTKASSPPLGVAVASVGQGSVQLHAGTTILLYTDGLVENRTRDLDAGIATLRSAFERHLENRTALHDLPRALVEDLLPDGPDDDIAVLAVRLDERAAVEATFSLVLDEADPQLSAMRRQVQEALLGWSAGQEVVDDVTLVVSELVTNALVHGRPPVFLRLRNGTRHLVLEVEDRATYLPQKRRPSADDENGRGLQLASLLSERWGTRASRHGKVVWCTFPPLG